MQAAMRRRPGPRPLGASAAARGAPPGRDSGSSGSSCSCCTVCGGSSSSSSSSSCSCSSCSHNQNNNNNNNNNLNNNNNYHCSNGAKLLASRAAVLAAILAAAWLWPAGALAQWPTLAADNSSQVPNSRCFASTILDDPVALEPEFVFASPHGDIRLGATAPLLAIRLAGFEPRKPTAIFVHGFTQSYPDTLWLRRVRALSDTHNYGSHSNLFIMDWGPAARGSYAQAAASVSAMAVYLATFVTKLVDLGAQRDSVHLVGHSLGAHLCGFAGKRLRPRIGRITALDPAGPCFGKLFSNGPNDRLTSDDARQVDVYHYDDDFLGLPGQHGHFDIYVNGGSSQPGCSSNVNAMVQAAITMVFRRNRVLSESHTRSTEVATSQLSRNGCQLVAYECHDYGAFAAGECGHCDDSNSQCFMMSLRYQHAQDELEPPSASHLRSPKPSKRLYISTSPNDPYCLHHYQLLVRFEFNHEQKQLARRNRWRVQLDLAHDRHPGARATAHAPPPTNVTVGNLVSGHIFTSLLLLEGSPARFGQARLQLLEPAPVAGSASVVAPSRSEHAPRPTSVEVNFMSNINPNIRRALSSRLCLVSLEWSQQQHESGWFKLDECLQSRSLH